MKLRTAVCGLLATAFVGAAAAGEGPVPKGIARLDRVFLIMMENHGYGQILNNPNAPFINQLANSANLATNYFAVGHPSLTNYLEVVGGSNFGVRSDNFPDWHNASCSTNLATGIPATDTPPTPRICPIWGFGTDAATPAVDTTNETQGPPGENNIDGVLSIAAAQNTLGETIADQLARWGHRWKSYQENLPLAGADLVNYSDGVFTNNTDFTAIHPALNPPLSQANVVQLYAVKHNPFAYFRSIQEGAQRGSGLENMAGFDGPGGLYADLATGNLPAFSFIAPNQCNDQHGRGNAGAFCNFDPKSDGQQSSLNPALILYGDVAVQKLVTAIKHSPAWREGNNAIIVMWDENDYSTAPNINQVMFIVDTNNGTHGMKSSRRYTHFSVLRTLEAGFALPCLNHACDPGVPVMSDLFHGGGGGDDRQDRH